MCAKSPSRFRNRPTLAGNVVVLSLHMQENAKFWQARLL
jgi:hypothetical protein